MIKRLLTSLAVSVILIGCSASAPNDVTLTTNPGVCVTSVLPGYEATPSSYSPYNSFPMNSYMPSNSPYCMSVTMTNNNSGENSNNIQVYQGGLSLTYVAAGTSYSAYMVDFNAAGLNQSNFGYTPVQQLGNLALFDPNNCVTTIGAKVNTLNKNGGQCTFYLQIVNESMPVGDYPLNISVNYTNGNQNYNVQTNVYQHSTMYIGGSFSSPSQSIAQFNANSTNAALPLGITTGISNPVQLMARDGVGNIYAYDGSSVYQFNGQSIVTTPSPPSGINQLSGDSFGNLFAATSSGLYVYNASASSSATWNPVANVSGVVNAVLPESSNQQNILYLTGANGVESCVYANNSCTPTLIFSGSGFNNAALGYNPAIPGLYWATNAGVYNNNSLIQTTGGVLIESGPLGVDPLGFIYAAGGTAIESQAVYSNLASSQLAPLSDNGSNSIFGIANGVFLRNYTAGTSTAFTLYAYGNSLSASNQLFLNERLAYLNMAASTNPSFTASSAWTPVVGLNGAVNSVVVASRLANN